MFNDDTKNIGLRRVAHDRTERRLAIYGNV